MNRDSRKILKFTLQMVAAWLVAVSFFYFLRNFGIVDPTVDLAMQEAQKSAGDYFSGLYMIPIGIFAGLLFTIFELQFDRPLFRRWSYGRLLAVKAGIYFVFTKIVLIFSTLLIARSRGTGISFSKLREILLSEVFWVVLAYFTVVILLITFIRQVNQKFGPGILTKMLLGIYHTPKEDRRIFMFLDLRASTTIAERIGHLRFSQLLQDCFYDLNEVVPKYQAEIYQYVGDEAVLSWTVDNGLKDCNCLKIYFEYSNLLQKKAGYYEPKYGVVPEFRAGVHFGNVTVAEVGVLKKEIAFHGDVLNTTSRIQGYCGVSSQQLLVSKELLSNLVLENDLESILIGDVQLKGKEQTVELHGIKNIY